MAPTESTLGAGQVISDPTLASVSVVGSGMQNTPGLRLKNVSHPGRWRHQPLT